MMASNVQHSISTEPAIASITTRALIKYSGMFFHIIIAFAVPFLFREPQLLVGTIVNFVLTTAAICKYPRRFLGLLCILPSVSAFAAGVLFGPFTMILLYLFPAIWGGNAVLIAFTGWKIATNVKKAVYIVVGIGVKILVISISAIILAVAGIIPAMMIPSFTWLQLVTATLGTISAIGLRELSRLFQVHSKKRTIMQ